MIDFLSENYYDRIAELYERWLKGFQKRKTAQVADFWNAFPEYKNRNRYTHMIHSYPAKLLASIPAFFITLLCKPGSKVLDPFCGSGTVLLEAAIRNVESYGVEVNPIARLISQVKITPLDPCLLREALAQIMISAHRIKCIESTIPAPLDFWFAPEVKTQLLTLRQALKKCADRTAPEEIGVWNFFWMCFSSLIRRKSLADPRVAPPVKLRPEKFGKNSVQFEGATKLVNQKRAMDTYNSYENICQENIERMKQLFEHTKEKDLCTPSRIIWDDARAIKQGNLKERGIIDYSRVSKFRSRSIDLIVTSPPYINAQKYTRSLSLEMYWLEHWHNPEDRAIYDQRVLGNERVKITGEFSAGIKTKLLKKELLRIANVDRKRAAIVNAFFEGLQLALQECYRVLKKGGSLVLVIGNNKIFGKEIPTHRILVELSAEVGFVLELILYDDIKSWGLMTKRNYTADIITREWILIFQKDS